jgi:flagellar hook-associated protein 1 FlgK
MPSQFFGLNIAASGLRAANAAVNTTANNISNVETKDYSRQEVKQQASNALRVFTTYGCAGAGVDTIAIERIRDAFYDDRYRTNEALLGNYAKKNYYNSLIEQYFKDDGTTGFNSLFGKVQANLQSAMTAPSVTTTKHTFVAAVEKIADYFNEMSTSFKNMQSDVNAEIKTIADAINSIAEEIAQLNEQINVVEMTGPKANELRDRRDGLVDKLSGYVSVKTKEIPIMDENDPNRETGASRFQVWIAGGQTLVDTYDYRQLKCIARDGKETVNQTDINGLFDIKWVRSDFTEETGFYLGDFDLYNANIGGKMQGLVHMRDGNNRQYFSGTSTEWDMENRTLKVRVSDDYLKNMSQCNLPGGGQITIGTRTYEYESWEYDGKDSYTFVLPEKNHANEFFDFSRVLARGDTVKIGAGIDYQGIPYYMMQMNEWVRNFSDKVNQVVTSGFTSDGEAGIYFLTGNRTVKAGNDPAQYTFEELSITNKGYYFVNAENFAVNDLISSNAALLATKVDISEGQDEGRCLRKLNDMISKTELFRGATSGEFLDKVLSDAALNSSNCRVMEKTYTALQSTIDNQRLSIYGVDSDEEAANLVKYQNAYALSAKVVNVLQEMYDRLILQTGV